MSNLTIGDHTIRRHCVSAAREPPLSISRNAISIKSDSGPDGSRFQQIVQSFLIFTEMPAILLLMPQMEHRCAEPGILMLDSRMEKPNDEV